jgi:RNA polymerase sigma-70 factor, ECF subfamily
MLFARLPKAGQLSRECRIEIWLLRIAVNLVRDHGKNRRTSFWKRLAGLQDRSTNDEPREFATPQPSPERVLLAREQLQSILSAVSSLPTQQRSIFLLRFAEEMSLAQIADVLDVKVGTVKAQLARATGKLREMKERQWR